MLQLSLSFSTRYNPIKYDKRHATWNILWRTKTETGTMALSVSTIEKRVRDVISNLSPDVGFDRLECIESVKELTFSVSQCAPGKQSLGSYHSPAVTSDAHFVLMLGELHTSPSIKYTLTRGHSGRRLSDVGSSIWFPARVWRVWQDSARLRQDTPLPSADSADIYNVDIHMLKILPFEMHTLCLIKLVSNTLVPATTVTNG